MIRIVAILILLPLAGAVLIQPGAIHKVGPICRDGPSIWDTSIDGRGSSFSVRYMDADDRYTDLIVNGTTIFYGIIPCSPPYQMWLGIENMGQEVVDITYNLNDITPGPNIFMFLFLILTPGIAFLGLMLSGACLAGGLLTARCMIGDTYLTGPIDNDLKERIAENAMPLIM